MTENLWISHWENQSFCSYWCSCGNLLGFTGSSEIFMKKLWIFWSSVSFQANIRMKKKIDFLSANSTNFRSLFFTVQRNKITQLFLSARAFSNDSRFQFFFVFFIIRDAQISEVKSLFCCSIEPKKKNQRDLQRDSKVMRKKKFAFLVEIENQLVLPSNTEKNSRHLLSSSLEKTNKINHFFSAHWVPSILFLFLEILKLKPFFDFFFFFWESSFGGQGLTRPLVFQISA
jgi:hypothetical protein